MANLSIKTVRLASQAYSLGLHDGEVKAKKRYQARIEHLKRKVELLKNEKKS